MRVTTVVCRLPAEEIVDFRMKKLIWLALLILPAAGANTVYTVELTQGNILLDGSPFLPHNSYYAVFQLTGGTTGRSFAGVSNIQMGGGSADPASIIADYAIYGFKGLSDGALYLQITPADGYSYFLQHMVAGTSFGFTVTLSGVYSPPVPDGFSFQLYSERLDLLYEQVFNVTSSGTPPPVPVFAPPAEVPEPSSWPFLAAGLSAVVYRGQRRSRS